MIQQNPNDCFCDAPDEGAALGLLGLMTGISEEYWCAGWMDGLEYSLWEAKSGQRYGQGAITERQSVLLRLLAEEAGGWWRWSDKAGPYFTTLADWQKHLTALARGK